MTHHRHLQSEAGMVMVPVIILLVVAIATSLALLALVDTQTGESREQRSADSAQTLAEGLVSATANVLAADPSVWPATTGPCVPVTGNLEAGTPTGTSLADKVTAEIKARFSGTSPELASTAMQGTTWKVDVCPVAAADTARWEETILARTSTVPASPAEPASVWVRGHASVRARTDATLPENARTVVSKIRQSSRDFDVPADFAVGTGAFSTDLGTTLGSSLISNNALLGGIVKPLIAGPTSKIGVRCGLLETIDNTGTTCVAGALAGAAAVTNAAGLGRLNAVLGLRNEALATWTMAPEDAIEAWRAEAKRPGNVYRAASSPLLGYGNDVAKSVGAAPAGRDCFSGATDATTVIFIEKVGNGDEYCNVPAGKTAKILIVERGGIHIKDGTFTGVVYALNKQECGSDTECSTEERESATPREVVRIDGNLGKVVGSVWADGAGGSVGIYPRLFPSNVSSSSLLNLGDVTTGICGIPGVSALVNTLNSTLGSLLGLVTGLLSLEQVRYWDGTPDGTTTAPGGCALLKSQLSSLTSSQLIDLYANGKPDQAVVTTIHRTRPTILSPWPSTWTTKTTSSLAFPVVLPAVAEGLAGLLGATLNGFTAIQYDADVVGKASAKINQGAAPLVGTYRNVGPST